MIQTTNSIFEIKNEYRKPVDLVQLEFDLIESLTKYEPIATKRLAVFYEKILKVNRSNNEKIVIVADSLADLKAIVVIAKCAQMYSKNVSVLYYRTNEYDDGVRAKYTLSSLDKFNIGVRYFDHLLKGEILAVEELMKSGPTIVISDLFDSYDLRLAINEYAVKNNLNIPEIPTLDLIALTSDAFATDLDKMNLLGEEIRILLDEMVDYHITDESDGTDLTVTAGKMLNEAANNFSYRPADYVKNKNLPEAIQDNYPCGEVWANIHNAKGKLVLYQVEPDMLR